MPHNSLNKSPVSPKRSILHTPKDSHLISQPKFQFQCGSQEMVWTNSRQSNEVLQPKCCWLTDEGLDGKMGSWCGFVSIKVCYSGEVDSSRPIHLLLGFCLHGDAFVWTSWGSWSSFLLVSALSKHNCPGHFQHPLSVWLKAQSASKVQKRN